jgi:hypothetical protein
MRYSYCGYLGGFTGGPLFYPKSTVKAIQADLINAKQESPITGSKVASSSFTFLRQEG